MDHNLQCLYLFAFEAHYRSLNYSLTAINEIAADWLSQDLTESVAS